MPDTSLRLCTSLLLLSVCSRGLASSEAAVTNDEVSLVQKSLSVGKHHDPPPTRPRNVQEPLPMESERQGIQEMLAMSAGYRVGESQESEEKEVSVHKQQQLELMHTEEMELAYREQLMRETNSSNQIWDKVSTDCLINTGVSCTNSDCQLGAGTHSVCQWDRCLCAVGCATYSGTCKSDKFKIIHDDFTMRDFRFGRYLFVDNALWHISMTKDAKSDYNRFTMMQTHDGKHIIYSKGNPDYAVTVAELIDPQSLRPSGSYEVQQANVKGAWSSVGFDPSVPNVAIELTAPPGGYNDSLRPEQYGFNGSRPVMLESLQFPSRYIFSPYWGSMKMLGDAGVNYDDPGDGALWVFDPPLPAALTSGKTSILKPYAGTRCSSDCHGADSKGVSKAVLAVITILVILLGCGALIACSGLVGGGRSII